MALVFGRLLLALAFALCFVAVIAPRVAPAADGPDVAVIVDQARLIRAPDQTATLVIGNPLIADVSLQPGGVLVITGKGYGRTNLIALDRTGAVLLDRTVAVVQSPSDTVVVVYRGVERETYSCAPECQRTITLGDRPPYFDAALLQTVARSAQALAVGSGAK
jgi:hypothetical protein